MRRLSLIFGRCLACTCALMVASVPASAQRVPLPAQLAQIDMPVALLVDASNGQVLFERAAQRRFVPASVTKVMTLFTAFELIEAGQLDPRYSLTVSPEAWMEWRGKGSTMFLNADDRVPLSDLLTGIATVSANDASYVLAEEAAGSLEGWTAQMNAKARAIGMTQSHFGTPNGWPDEGGTFTTARDLVVLAKALLDDHPKKVARFIGNREFTYNGITQSNHDPMIGRVEGADGIKTGYTNEAGFNYLGTAKRGDQRLILVVAGGKRKSERAAFARGLVEWGFSAFDRQNLFAKGARVAEVAVQNGSARRVALVTQRDVFMNVPKGRGGDLRVSVAYNGPLRAPITAGDEVATLVIEAPDMQPARIPLLAEESVRKAGFFARIANAFSGWLS
ncbi:MAG: D-alanyl-D-alanine carboxypeptidase family protein [Pseudomonadota bacterium]